METEWLHKFFIHLNQFNNMENLIIQEQANTVWRFVKDFLKSYEIADMKTKLVECAKASEEEFTFFSKLDATSKTQGQLIEMKAFIEETGQTIVLELENLNGIIHARWDGVWVGILHKSYASWLTPLIEGVQCEVTAITGGGDKKFHGCNICLNGLHVAVESFREGLIF